MKSVLVLVLSLCGACGAPATSTVTVPVASAASTSPPPPTTPLPTPDSDVETAARRFGSSLEACDITAALNASVSYDEVVATTHKDVNRAEYDEELGGFIRSLCREFQEAGAKVVGAKTVNTRVLRQSDDPERLKQDVEITFVHFVVERDGQRQERGIPFMFMRTPRGWRFLFKH